MTVSVNVVVLAGTIAADPVERRMPSGEECTEIRLSVPEPGRRLLPLPVVAWHTEVGKKRLRASTTETRCWCTGGSSAASTGAGRRPEPHGGRGERPQAPGAERASRTQTSIATAASDDAWVAAAVTAREIAACRIDPLHRATQLEGRTFQGRRRSSGAPANQRGGNRCHKMTQHDQMYSVREAWHLGQHERAHARRRARDPWSGSRRRDTSSRSRRPTST